MAYKVIIRFKDKKETEDLVGSFKEALDLITKLHSDNKEIIRSYFIKSTKE